MRKNIFIEKLNILDGIITYNDFDIDSTVTFEDQKYSFKEDILQIEFGERFVLDVGWYPEFEPSGHFNVQAIQDNDWMNPVLKMQCHTLGELKVAIEKTVVLIGEIKNQNLPFRNVEYDAYD